MHTIGNKIRKWAQKLPSSGEVDKIPDYIGIHSHIEYLSEKLYNEYIPTKGVNHKNFILRLKDWLDSAPLEKDQQQMLQLVPYLFFIGEDEFNSLYRAAYDGPIKRWLIDVENIDLFDANLNDKMNDAVSSTLFCAVTDSFNINKFTHINNLSLNPRPILNSYANPSNMLATLTAFMSNNSKNKIVILEDFIGTGSQSISSVDQIVTGLPQFPVLVSPLVIGQDGNKLYKSLVDPKRKSFYEPILVLSDETFLFEVPKPEEPPFFDDLRKNVIEKLYPLVKNNNPNKLYGPYGFCDQNDKKGSLVVLCTNCSDNTLPMIHRNSSKWKALFPRDER